MPRRLRILFLLSIVFAYALLGRPSLAAQPMNVLLITADDLGIQLSSYGETLIETPRLDALAASGVRFEIAYAAQASCSPSRASMLTGMYVHSTGQYGLVHTGLSLDEGLRDSTLPNILKRAGYRTGIIGKLHVAPEDSFRFDSRERLDTRKVRLVAERANAFVEASAGQPFFLMVNYSDPHVTPHPEDRSKRYFPPQVDGVPDRPLQPSEKTIFDFQQTDTPEQRVRTAGYYAAVQRLDVAVGLLLDGLEKRGHAEDTLVIFVGDHGPPFTRGKTTAYEAGLRIPFLVRWPGVSKSMVSPAMVSTVDILPTILDAAGVTVPARVQGRSLRPVLSNPKAPSRAYLVGEFHFHGLQTYYPMRAIRDHRYKLIHNLLAERKRPLAWVDGDRALALAKDERYVGTPVARAFETFAHPPEFELYDLQDDSVEFRNLADDPARRRDLERLKAALLVWRGEYDDPFLDDATLQRYLDYSQDWVGDWLRWATRVVRGRGP